MKKLFYILPIFLTIVFMPTHAHADGLLTLVLDAIAGIFSNSPFQQLSDNIIKLAALVNWSISNMMKFGDMLMCSGLHGASANISLGPVSVKFISFKIFFSGVVLYVVGFLVLLTSSFYLFDAAFNLSIAVILLPLVLALWPFGWTRDKLSGVIKSIVYYTGLFMFLPLGILIAKELIYTAVEKIFLDSAGYDLMEIYKNDQADLLEEHFSIFETGFITTVIFCIVALRIIPLFAADFCKYYFGSSLVGSPMLDRITEMGKHLMKQGKKAGKFGMDIAKHQSGNKVKDWGRNMSGYRGRAGWLVRPFGRVLSQYGKNMARTRRGR